jgi:hypothetical protein
MRAALLTGALFAAAAPLVADVRIRPSEQPLTDAWRRTRVAARGRTALGISFRPLQALALELDPRAALEVLLAYPFAVVRLAAYWDRIEVYRGDFDFSELDWQVDAAVRAGKQIVLCVGAVKAFGYPEYFVPGHHLDEPIREHTLVSAKDPARPMLLNAFLPSSMAVTLQQRWRTRGQGDSLEFAARLGDIVGIDYYPRHAVLRAGPITAYLKGHATWARRRMTSLLKASGARHQRVFITEGQAEPWETATTPPSPRLSGMSSCLPEHVISNYNRCIDLSRDARVAVGAYLFWGAEYWLRRQHCGDPRYLNAFARVLEDA